MKTKFQIPVIHKITGKKYRGSFSLFLGARLRRSFPAVHFGIWNDDRFSARGYLFQDSNDVMKIGNNNLIFQFLSIVQRTTNKYLPTPRLEGALYSESN